MANLATVPSHGTKLLADGICPLGMVAEIEAGMAQARLGTGVSDRLLFRDDIRFPHEINQAHADASADPGR
jgi:hypothetical protein